MVARNGCGMRHPGVLAAALAGHTLLLAGCGGTPAPSLLSGRACLARLDAQEVSYRPLAEIPASSSSCHVDTAVRVSRVAAGLNHPAVMRCAPPSRPHEVGRQGVQPLAREEPGPRVL